MAPRWPGEAPKDAQARNLQLELGASTQLPQVFRQLLSAGLLSADLGRIAGLRLTGDSWSVLKGERNVLFRRDPVASKVHNSRKPLMANRSVFETGDSQQLFERLRKLRLAISRTLEVPPYVIFADTALKEMAVVKPATVDEFRQITGVGAYKAQRYSAVFLDCIRGKEIDLSRYVENFQT